MEELLKVLNEFRPDIDFVNNTALIDEGLLDSLDIINIISELDFKFDIEIPVEEITPENFNSAKAMLQLIDRLKNEV